MKKLILMTFLTFSLASHAQDLKKIEKEKAKLQLFEEEKFPEAFNEIYKKNVGKVLFSNSKTERALPASEYITTFTLGDKLFLRGFYEHSVSNSILLQLVESGMKTKDINGWKDSFDSQTRLISNLYFDDQFIASSGRDEYLNEEDMTRKNLSMKHSLNDGTETLWMGEIPFQKLLGKQELLTPGKHKLKIEQVPLKTFGGGADFQYKPIAVGEIEVIVPKEIKFNESDCFPKAAIKDAKLEAETLKAVKKFYKDGAPNAFKVILFSNEMKIIRQEYTGVILRKAYDAVVVSKKGDEVWYNYYTFHKEYNGSKYEEAVINNDVATSIRAEGKVVNKGCLKFLK